jgi:hypothetical protein
MRCSICEEKITGWKYGNWKHPHYEAIHPQYAAWTRRWFRNFFALVVPLVLALILSEFLWLSYGGVYGEVYEVLIVFFAGIVVYDVSWIRLRTYRRFVREWKAEHKSNIPAL